MGKKIALDKIFPITYEKSCERKTEEEVFCLIKTASAAFRHQLILEDLDCL